MSWQKNLEKRIKLFYPLKEYTTFRVGGRVRYFFTPQNLEELKFALDFAKAKRVPLYVLGGGSNILLTDRVLNALVVKFWAGHFKEIDFKKEYVFIGAGLELSKLIRACSKKNLGGMEFLAGIPGTLGGALVMNAGTKDKSISELIEEVTVMDYCKRIRVFKRKKIHFGYRQSSISDYIILMAVLKLKRTSSEEIKENIRNYLDYRKQTQPLSYPSAGCIFKNPKNNLSAGMLIELCGLKGKRVGDACVSLQHANFIVNLGKARFLDIIKLIRIIQRKVKQKFRVDLEPEIKIWQ